MSRLSSEVSAIRSLPRSSLTRPASMSVVELGSGSSPLPSFLTHGWPGSFMEYLKLIAMLAHPGELWEVIQMKASTVVVPSLAPDLVSPRVHLEKGILPTAKWAELWNEVNDQRIGFDSYVAPRK